MTVVPMWLEDNQTTEYLLLRALEQAIRTAPSGVITAILAAIAESRDAKQAGQG